MSYTEETTASRAAQRPLHSPWKQMKTRSRVYHAKDWSPTALGSKRMRCARGASAVMRNQAKYAVKKVATFIAITAAHPRKKGVPKDAHNLTAAGPLSTLNGQTLLDEHGRRRRRKLCCCCYGEGIDGLSGGRENGCLDNDDDWTDGDGEVWTDGDDGGGGSATSF
uniref:Uncharacterized protein n=1 Tax=Globodera rostochiensis TaxID=31243 RepID=A0A914HLY4_GLORO